MTTKRCTYKIKSARILLITLLLMGQTIFLSAAPKQKGVAFDFGIGAGYSTLGYKTQSTDLLNANATGSWGMRANIGVNYFFNNYFGIGIGAAFTRYGGGMSLNGTMLWEGVTDTDGERYNHHLRLNNWREIQQQLFLAPNLTLQAVIPADRARVLIRFGAEYAACLQASYSCARHFLRRYEERTAVLLQHDITDHQRVVLHVLSADIQQPRYLVQCGDDHRVGILLPHGFAHAG